MINETDIEAFRADIEIVQEFVRRAEKGLPEDRWTSGAKGNAKLAAACRGLIAYTNLQASVMLDMHNHIQQAGADSMTPHADPARQAD